MYSAPTFTAPTFTAPDGARLAYRDEGTGLPLLCLAGLTRGMADFEALAPHLPPLRLIRMDCRGRGQSQWTGSATYTLRQEAQDALALLDQLGIARAAILGTSRGGLIGMFLGATAPGRVLGLLLNDVGPVIERTGLGRILAYLGRAPKERTHAEMAAVLARSPGFAGVPAARWLEEAQRLWVQTPDGLALPYDPALRDGFEAAYSSPPANLWPMFEACAGLPMGLIRGAGSDLLSAETAAEMHRRRPDLIYADVPGRGHVPFLDEPESLAVVQAFLAACA